MDKQTRTLTRFLVEEQMKHPGATGAFTELFADITLAAKIVSREVNKAGLAEILGVTGEINVHGEEVKKLDEFANEIFKHVLLKSGIVAAIASEEEDEVVISPPGRYIVVYDPLDGSSNIEVNVSIGTIFGIYRNNSGENVSIKDFLRSGRELVAAGYLIYGSSTMLVYTTGQGVHGFTLDPSIGEFILSHYDIKIPEEGKIYSINEAYESRWDDKMKSFIKNLKENGKTLRYIGSLVADFHRNLLKGGIFLYPADRKNPHGKLRLLYEAIPLAFIVEQAGGYASDGKGNILDRIPESIHEKTPLFIGSRKEVEKLENFLKYG